MRAGRELRAATPHLRLAQSRSATPAPRIAFARKVRENQIASGPTRTRLQTRPARTNRMHSTAEGPMDRSLLGCFQFQQSLRLARRGVLNQSMVVTGMPAVFPIV